MKNMKLVTLVIVLLIVSISCNLFTPSSPANGVKTGNISQGLADLPAFDPEAPLPSPGAAALRRLMELDPSVAILESDVEAAERAAMNALLADLQAQLSAGNGIEVFNLASHSGTAKLVIPSLDFSLPASSTMLGEFDGGTSTSHDAAVITGVVSGWNDQMTPNVQTGAGTSGSATETEGGATNTSSIDLGRNADGSTKFGFGSKTEVTKNGVSAKTEVAASLDGQRCPNAEGQVSFTVKVRLGAESGGAGQSQDLTAFVRVVVDDDANISKTTIDVTHGIRQVKDGRQVYVEAGETVKYDGGDIAGLELSNARIIRHSQDATQADASALSEAGFQAALSMAHTALAFAKQNWLNGGCTKIEAASPGTVEPGSTTAIPVKVRHRFEGIEIPSKLKAELSGRKSVDPTKLPKTPGTLTYTAPGESNKSATITLTATSRRGKATLKLTANTGEPSYKVNDEGLSGRSWVTQCIPSLDKPYQILWKSPEATGEYSFTPDTGNRTSGKAEIKITTSIGDVTSTQEGEGTYIITVLSKDSEGNPVGLSIDYDVKGTVVQCIGGDCITTEMPSSSASVPITVNDKSCK